MSWKEEERGGERKKMPFIVATYVYASSQGQRTHSARTNETQPSMTPNLAIYGALNCTILKISGSKKSWDHFEDFWTILAILFCIWTGFL